MKAAAIYAKRLGWRVVPLHDVSRGICSCQRGADCDHAGKHPRLKDWVNEATADAERVAEWIEQFPAANVGLATGAGMFVLDVDPDAGGFDSLAALIADHGDLPETAVAETGSGGRHYFFKASGRIPNKVGRFAGPGLDVRGDGGQVVAAPSRSLKGAYRWLRDPFKHEIAVAPVWLVTLIRARAPAEIAQPSERGYFPPASAEVLAAARDALERHGPAVENSGGDDHTFRACALLSHDFALTDDEAWPLLAEWNETCSPPWDETDLRAKLAGGAKYGSAEYGKRRSMDALQRATKAIEDWRLAGAQEGAIRALAEAVRAIAASGVDSIDRALIEKRFKAETDIGKRELDLPTVRPPGDTPKGTIIVTPKVNEVADEAIKALAPFVFQRNGVLCEIAKTTKSTFINDLEPARLQDLMSEAANWARHDEKQGLVPQAPPMPIAAILHARRQHPDAIRALDAVTTAPVFLADGSILQQRGYNKQARVFLEPSVAVDVPEFPSRDEARIAARMFIDLLHDFRLPHEDLSAWVAALLSPLVRAATGNAPAPMLCITASSAGAGKSLLADVLSIIVHGDSAETRSYTRDINEWGKRITSFVRAGSALGILDNVAGRFGDEVLDRLLTARTWADRILGASEAPPLPIVTTWIATGNNIEPVGDTVRRVMVARITVDTERPQERTGFRIPELLAHVRAHRGELLSAALTILRAYHVADRPKTSIPTWGSFEDWSALVRQTLVWVGFPDPFKTQQRAQTEFSEPMNDAHDFWISVVEACPDGQATSIAARANQQGAREVLGAREDITRFTLRSFINQFVGKPRGKKRLARDGSGYRVDALEPPK